MILRYFQPVKGSNQIVTPSTTSASTAINAVNKSVRFVNSGDNICHVRIGSGSQTATTSDIPLLPQSSLVIGKGGGEETIAYISPFGTTLHIQSGEGFEIKQNKRLQQNNNWENLTYANWENFVTLDWEDWE